MGSCEVKAAPTCGGATSAGRSIGYYRESDSIIPTYMPDGTNNRLQKVEMFATDSATAFLLRISTLKGLLT
jgi:hypothetical protein